MLLTTVQHTADTCTAYDGRTDPDRAQSTTRPRRAELLTVVDVIHKLDRKRVVAKFSKSRFWSKVPKGSTLIFEGT